jgi:hypothetical protein
MSDVRNVRNEVEIAIPAIPVHLIVKICHRNIQSLHVHLHDLAGSGRGVAKSLFPFGKPLLFDGILAGCGEVVFHVPFKANRCSEHFTVLHDMTDAFARLTLNICKEGAPVAVEAGKATLLARTFGGACIVSTSIITGLLLAPPITTGLSTMGIVGMVQPTKTINQKGVREALDARTIHIQPVNTRGDNIPKSALCILVDAFSQTVQPEMGQEESCIELFTVLRIHVGL